MSKARNSKAAMDDLRPEYRFDYTKSRPNPYASRLEGTTVGVVLDADVAEVFTTSDAVNEALRTVTRVVRRAAVPRKARRAGYLHA
jgi:hypothetical protein